MALQDAGHVRALGGVPLEVFGLGEGELQFLGQRAGEVVAAERDRPLPDDLAAVGDDEVRGVGADVHARPRTAFLAPRRVVCLARPPPRPSGFGPPFFSSS